MKNKPAKTHNDKYRKQYYPLREFIRLISYGCYHRSLFPEFGIAPRSYDDSGPSER